MKIISRAVVREEDLPMTAHCVECGSPIVLYFNGGELDSGRCCGKLYALEITAIELVISEDDDT